MQQADNKHMPQAMPDSSMPKWHGRTDGLTEDVSYVGDESHVSQRARIAESNLAALIAEGRALLTASYAAEDLLPLDVDRKTSLPRSWPEGLGWFVCDRNGLSWANSRNDDKPTAELIAWAVNHLSQLLDALARVEQLTVAPSDEEYEHNTSSCAEAECPACWVLAIRQALAIPQAVPGA